MSTEKKLKEQQRRFMDLEEEEKFLFLIRALQALSERIDILFKSSDPNT